MQRLLLTTLITAAAHLSMTAQTLTPEVVASGGDHYENAYAQLSVTVGEPVTETVSGTGATLTQGFHQTQYVIASVAETKDDDVSFTLYPNPASGVLHLRTHGPQHTTFHYTLLSPAGQTITTGKTDGTAGKENISMQGLSGGMYYLRIHDDKHHYAKTFKINKISVR